MRNFVVFRRKGDATVWVADLESETLARMDLESLPAAGFAADSMPTGPSVEGDTPVVNGIDFALAASVQSEAPSHELYKRPTT